MEAESVIPLQVEKSRMFIMQQDANLQRRLLHDSLLHPHSPSVLVAIPVAGGGVIPAGGVVPATATDTAPVAEAEGADPTSSRSESGGKVGGLQRKMSACNNIEA
jgi:hypothetical protein